LLLLTTKVVSDKVRSKLSAESNDNKLRASWSQRSITSRITHCLNCSTSSLKCVEKRNDVCAWPCWNYITNSQ